LQWQEARDQVARYLHHILCGEAGELTAEECKAVGVEEGAAGPWNNKVGFVKDSKLTVQLQNKLDETFKPYRDLLSAGNYRRVSLEAPYLYQPPRFHPRIGTRRKVGVYNRLYRLLFKKVFSKMRGFRRAFAAVEDAFTATIADQPVMSQHFMAYCDALVEISPWDNITTAEASTKVIAHCLELHKEHGESGAMDRAHEVLQGALYETDNEGEGSEEGRSVEGE
jgi:hypothetical protein